MSAAVQQIELEKARKREKEQAIVLQHCKDIVNGPDSLPTLKQIAKARLPKLQQTYDLTLKVIQELETALGLGSQPQLPLSSPVDNLNKRR